MTEGQSLMGSAFLISAPPDSPKAINSGGSGALPLTPRSLKLAEAPDRHLKKAEYLYLLTHPGAQIALVLHQSVYIGRKLPYSPALVVRLHPLARQKRRQRMEGI